MAAESKPVTSAALYLVALAAERPDAIGVLHGVLRVLEDGVSPDQFWRNYTTGREVNQRVNFALKRAEAEVADVAPVEA